VRGEEAKFAAAELASETSRDKDTAKQLLVRY
jgi:hypothetical protein